MFLRKDLLLIPRLTRGKGVVRSPRGTEPTLVFISKVGQPGSLQNINVPCLASRCIEPFDTSLLFYATGLF